MTETSEMVRQANVITALTPEQEEVIEAALHLHILMKKHCMENAVVCGIGTFDALINNLSKSQARQALYKIAELLT